METLHKDFSTQLNWSEMLQTICGCAMICSKQFIDMAMGKQSFLVDLWIGSQASFRTSLHKLFRSTIYMLTFKSNRKTEIKRWFTITWQDCFESSSIFSQSWLRDSFQGNSTKRVRTSEAHSMRLLKRLKTIQTRKGNWLSIFSSPLQAQLLPSSIKYLDGSIYLEGSLMEQLSQRLQTQPNAKVLCCKQSQGWMTQPLIYRTTSLYTEF